MKLQRLIILLCAFVVAALLYVASPLMSAYNLREAIRANDTVALSEMVAWPSFRASLRHTIAQNTKLLPAATAAANEIRPTLWQRVRSFFGHSMLDRFIENYATPEGLPKLYNAKERWHEGPIRVNQDGPAIDEKKSSIEMHQANLTNGFTPLVPRGIWANLRRIQRAEFVTPFTFILEIEDRHKPDRIIQSTFRLDNIGWYGFFWKLEKIAIHMTGKRVPTQDHAALAHSNRPQRTRLRKVAYLNGFSPPRRQQLNGFLAH